MLIWLAPIVVFGLVVFVHELGHFLAAKALGVYAPRFSIGFGKVLPFIPMFGDGKQPMQPVFVADVGRVVASAALEPAAGIAEAAGS